MIAVKKLTKEQKQERKIKKRELILDRIWELDFLRGFCILLMCVDHLFYDVSSMYSYWMICGNPFLVAFNYAARRYEGYVDPVLVPFDKMDLSEYVFLWLIILLVSISFIITLVKSKQKPNRTSVINYVLVVGIAVIACVSMELINEFVGYSEIRNSLRDFIHTIILWFFFLLCGIGCRLSKNNFKRALQIGICAGLISLFTYLAEIVLDESGMLVTYGVLHMLATAVLIYALIELVCRFSIKNAEVRKYVISGICLVIGIVVYFLNQYWSVHTPELRAQWMVWLHNGFKEHSIRSSDYFSICSSFYKVMFGAALAPFIYPDKKSLFPELKVINKGAFCFMGRHTLWVVLIHQLAISGVLFLLDFFILDLALESGELAILLVGIGVIIISVILIIILANRLCRSKNKKLD